MQAFLFYSVICARRRFKRSEKRMTEIEFKVRLRHGARLHHWQAAEDIATALLNNQPTGFYHPSTLVNYAQRRPNQN